MECACIGSGYDGDGWDFEPSEKFPVARKNWKCCECGRTIPVGEKHSFFSGKCDGSWQTYRTCLDCRSITDHLFCGYVFECVWDELTDYINCSDGDVGMWSKIALLTPKALEKVCDLIEHRWKKDETNQ